MSITDELREFMDGADGYELWCPRHKEELNHIADRIDAEHESACAEAYGNGVMSVPIALDESAWVELPKDADGEYINVGDRLDGYGKTIEVVEMRYGRSGWVLISRDGNGYADTFAFAHHHEPTVEDVLCELLNEYREGGCALEETRLSDYADKLRMVDENE